MKPMLPILGAQMMQPQVDPWRQQLQQMYSSGLLGSRQGTQSYSGPSTHMAYAMSGQGRYLNPAAQTGQSDFGQNGTGTMPGDGSFAGQAGGPITNLIQQALAWQQQQGGLLGNQSGRVQIPTTPPFGRSY